MAPLIFVVDDEPALVRIVKINLERMGYEVQTASDGHEALTTLQAMERKPDLLLSDVIMPYMDGYALLQRLKEDENLQAIPVVLVTARSRDADIVEAQARGAAGYLTKPIVLEELFNMVREVLSQDTSPDSDSVPKTEA